MAASDSPGRGGQRAPRTPAPQRRKRRARRGSVEQPINGRLVRGASLLVLGPLLLLALTIGRPGPFPGLGAAAVVRRTVGDRRSRPSSRSTIPIAQPGSAGAAGAADWFKEKLALYGLATEDDAWDETHPGARARPAAATSSPSSRARRDDAILVLAHRDNTGVGPGANDNASGTAALIELARGYGRLGTVAGRPKPQHTLIFLSSDGGAYGGFGAERFASTSPFRDRIKAVVSLDGLAGTATAAARARRASSRARPLRRSSGRPTSRSPRQLGRPPARPGWLVQLVDLGVPFGYGEQAPFLGRKISAIRLTTAPDDDAAARRRHAGPARRDPLRPARPGRRVDSRVARRRHRARRRHCRARLPRQPDHPRLGDRARPDRRARPVPRRRDRPLRPQPAATAAAARGLARRCGRGSASGSGSGSSIGLGALAGVFPRGSAIPPPPDSPAVTDWPVAGLVVLAAARRPRLVARAAGAGARRARRRRTRCSPATPSRSSPSAASPSRPR